MSTDLASAVDDPRVPGAETRFVTRVGFDSVAKGVEQSVELNPQPDVAGRATLTCY
jgi:hypothetical protein